MHWVSSLPCRAGYGEEMLRNIPLSPAPNTRVTLSPPAAKPCPCASPESPGAWETPLLLRGARLHSEPPNKALLSERKRSRGERSKRKGGRGRRTKGKGQLCTPAPALPELFLLMTAPISVGLLSPRWSQGRAREGGELSLTCTAGKSLRG